MLLNRSNSYISEFQLNVIKWSAKIVKTVMEHPPRSSINIRNILFIHIPRCAKIETSQVIALNEQNKSNQY